MEESKEKPVFLLNIKEETVNNDPTICNSPDISNFEDYLISEDLSQGNKPEEQLGDLASNGVYYQKNEKKITDKSEDVVKDFNQCAHFIDQTTSPHETYISPATNDYFASSKLSLCRNESR